jgi:OOP family OmpA-OmpF porin
VPAFGNFAINSSVLTAPSARYLARVGRQVKTAKLVICTGYTQPNAPAAYLRALSRRRARAACAALRAAGLTAHFRVIGAGSANPRATNRTAAGRALNRRVEIVIVR